MEDVDLAVLLNLPRLSQLGDEVSVRIDGHQWIKDGPLEVVGLNAS
jgi:hypothetical protein